MIRVRVCGGAGHTKNNGMALPVPSPRLAGTRVLWTGLLLAVSACSPLYVIRAGLAEMEILGARRPISEAVLDPSLDARTRGILTLVSEARLFARDELGLNVGGSYTSYTELESDTLALVLTGAYRDRFVPVTWWFPVVGHVPYRGFFNEEAALEEQARLEARGFDTWLRPTAAFSTLGWFDDPLLSSVVGDDEVEAVTTVLHELSHNHLFVPGRVRFNESYATFVGRAGAVAFFCTRPGGGPDTVWCLRARARWRDARRFSDFLAGFIPDLEALYADPRLSSAGKVARREEIFDRALETFGSEVSPSFESLGFGSFETLPLNNATLLSRDRYYADLQGFEALREACGGVAAAVAHLAASARDTDDPFGLLREACDVGSAPGRRESPGRRRGR